MDNNALKLVLILSMDLVESVYNVRILVRHVDHQQNVFHAIHNYFYLVANASINALIHMLFFWMVKMFVQVVKKLCRVVVIAQKQVSVINVIHHLNIFNLNA